MNQQTHIGQKSSFDQAEFMETNLAMDTKMMARIDFSICLCLQSLKSFASPKGNICKVQNHLIVSVFYEVKLNQMAGYTLQNIASAAKDGEEKGNPNQILDNNKNNNNELALLHQTF